MKHFLTLTALAAMTLTTACGFKYSDAQMTRADVQAREDAISGFPVASSRLNAIIAETPSLAHLKK